MADKSEMGFLDHLEELRWRIIKALIGVVIGSIITLYFIEWIMDSVLFAPATNTVPPLSIINIRPYGQFVLYMEVESALNVALMTDRRCSNKRTKYNLSVMEIC